MEPIWCRDHRGKTFTFDEALSLVESFHGYPAPGVILGVRMVTLAMQELPDNILFDAISETRTCLPDAVQLLTPCTVGNNWLQVIDFGRFAVTLYDKYERRGVRVSMNTSKAQKCPHVRDWFFKLSPKKEQDTRLLLKNIRDAGQSLLTLKRVRVAPDGPKKKAKGTIAICPQCGEAYPEQHGERCRGCQGQSPYVGPPGPSA